MPERRRVQITRTDTGESWPTITEASAALYLTQSAISYLTKRSDEGEGTVCGIPIRWKRTDRYARNRAVICLDTGETWPSATAAAPAVGVHPTSLCEAIRDRRATGPDNRRYAYTDNMPRYVRPKRKRKSPPVRCIETGEVYESMVAAARATGYTYAGIAHAARKGWACSGLHWEFIDEEETEE